MVEQPANPIIANCPDLSDWGSFILAIDKTKVFMLCLVQVQN
jgi:hypothetical protein